MSWRAIARRAGERGDISWRDIEILAIAGMSLAGIIMPAVDASERIFGPSGAPSK